MLKLVEKFVYKILLCRFNKGTRQITFPPVYQKHRLLNNIRDTACSMLK